MNLLYVVGSINSNFETVANHFVVAKDSVNSDQVFEFLKINRAEEAGRLNEAHWDVIKIPETVPIAPFDDGQMELCWASWRVIDAAYGVSGVDYFSRVTLPDGIVAKGCSESDKNVFRFRLAIDRLLIAKPMTVEEIMSSIKSAKKTWFSRLPDFVSKLILSVFLPSQERLISYPQDGKTYWYYKDWSGEKCPKK